jgi:CelD/BcsL family acetyltransferase involved in cellulose biosynthesis
MHCRLISTPEAFAALRPAWDALVRRAHGSSIFLSHAWFDAAWQWRCREAVPFIIACEQDGELAGILPLVRASAGRTLEFLAVPDTQRCDVIAAPGEVAAVAAALAEELVQRRGSWDALRLRYLPAGSCAILHLVPALATKGIATAVRAATSNPYIDLAQPFGPWLSGRSRRLKKALNLAANRLARAGNIDVRSLAPAPGDAAAQDEAIRIATAISARSWKTRTGNALDQPGPRAFLHRLASRTGDREAINVWTLTLDEAPIAMELQLVDAGHVHALRSDFVATFEPVSPGTHLSRIMLERSMGTHFERYWMGPGGNAYKYRWTEDADPVEALDAYAPTLRGRSLATWECTLRPLGRRVHDRWAHARRPEEPVTDDNAA